MKLEALAIGNNFRRQREHLDEQNQRLRDELEALQIQFDDLSEELALKNTECELAEIAIHELKIRKTSPSVLPK